MDNEYKLNLVKQLPQPEKEKEQRPQVGGFGLPEDDLIYQMVIKNLTEEVHPTNKRPSRNRKGK